MSFVEKNLSDEAFALYGISKETLERATLIEERLSAKFQSLDKLRTWNQLRVLKAMQDASLSDTDFIASSGYGYNDRGRETLERIYAQVFETEAALVRIQITTGTQAIAMALMGILRPGDELLAVTGKPYDTLDSVIGIDTDQSLNSEVNKQHLTWEAWAQSQGSLKDFGISYDQVDLLSSGLPDLELIKKKINSRTRMILIQRSRGYASRPALNIASIQKIVETIRSVSKDIVIFCDNCYGEFTEDKEPTAVGVDLCAGSLIKNPGGGLAPGGAYLCGSQNLIDKVSARFTAPGLGSEVGPSLGFNRLLIQGFYLAPHIVVECLKGLSFASAWLQEMGIKTEPSAEDSRSDIVQTLEFQNAEDMITFCQCVQAAAPVDSFVSPIPWAMPGYDSEVIMAAGAFIQGSSIELSADGPVREPYRAFMQGGLVYDNIKLAMLLAAQQMKEKEPKNQ